MEYNNTYKACNASIIRMCDDSASKVVGIDIVKMKMYDSAVRMFTNVRRC